MSRQQSLGQTAANLVKCLDIALCKRHHSRGLSEP